MRKNRVVGNYRRLFLLGLGNSDVAVRRRAVVGRNGNQRCSGAFAGNGYGVVVNACLNALVAGADLAGFRNGVFGIVADFQLSALADFNTQL